MGKPISNFNAKVGLSYDEMLNDDFNFDMDSHDVMVFLHMQKTGNLMYVCGFLHFEGIFQEELLLGNI